MSKLLDDVRMLVEVHLDDGDVLGEAARRAMPQLERAANPLVTLVVPPTNDTPVLYIMGATAMAGTVVSHDERGHLVPYNSAEKRDAARKATR